MPIEPHAAEPDGFGGCARCVLPPANTKVHPPGPAPVRAPSYTPAVEALDAPATSAAAAVAAEPRRGELRRAILALLAARGPMTDDALEVALGKSHQSVSSARNALTHDLLVAQAADETGAPVTRPTRSGRSAIAWTVTPLGRAAAA